MSALHTTLLSWPSLCKKLSTLMEICRSSDENNLDCFLRHGVHSGQSAHDPLGELTAFPKPQLMARR